MSEGVIKVSVIRAKPEDGLNTIVEYVQKAANNKVFLILPVDNDLVHSSIGLRTLHKKALEAKKELIVSLPTSAAVQNATEQGLVATTIADVTDVPPQLWSKAHEQLLQYTTSMLYGEKDAADGLSGRDFKTTVSAPAKVETPKRTSGITGLKLTGDQIRTKRNLKPLLWVISTILILVLAVALSGFLIYYRFFPRVYVTVSVKATPFERTITIIGDPKLEGINAATKRLGITEVVLTEEETISKDVTTEVEEGTYATGKVRVFNSGSTDLVIPLGTVFEAEGKQFVSTTSVTIAPAQSVDVPVKATAIGEEYNIPAYTKFNIQVDDFDPAIHQTTTPNAFTGGSKTKVKVVTKEEVDAATKEVEDALKERLTELLNEYNRDQGYVLIKDSVKYEIIDTIVDPEIGSKAQQFTVTLKMKARAFFYKEDELKSLVEQIVVNDIKGQEELSQLEVREMRFDILEIKFDPKTKQATIKVKATGIVGTHITEEDLWELIKDKKFDDVEKAIKDKYGDNVKDIEVVFTPSWIPRKLWYLPKEQPRVSIYIKN